jgi:hypothetical protein
MASEADKAIIEKMIETAKTALEAAQGALTIAEFSLKTISK